MDNKEAGKISKKGAKPFMTAGPTLHYSHRNVQLYWLLALAVFVATSFFWSKILTGSIWSFDPEALFSPASWYLNGAVTNGVSIFEYPWQIFVLGLVMAILAVTPLLISQLMKFSYSLLFILSLVFLANLPILAVCVCISCIGVACRPLRFRSRFIAIALCMAPQLLYWGFFASTRGVEPIKWGFSFTPWICAWLVSLAIAGLILGIGHFTRYRPGLVWAVTFLVLLTAIGTFELRIGSGELDYQLYVAENNPEDISEFYDHSITELLDEIVTNPSNAARRYLERSFYPTEPIPLRTELKEEIQYQLSHDRWPRWLNVPERLRYQAQRQWLFSQYDYFITSRPTSRRMPIALYYKAILSEFSPDINVLEQKEIIRFYSDYSFERSQDTWYWLYAEFSESPESIEARWRIATYWAGQEKFEQADRLLGEAQRMATKQLKKLEQDSSAGDKLFSPFRPPAVSAITISKLNELPRKLNQLRSLISDENRTKNSESSKRLAKFILLNPHASNYAWQLDRLLEEMGNADPLRDNVLLAQTKLIADEQLRAQSLGQLHRKFKETDGGMQALYELSLLKISFWRLLEETNVEQKKKSLAEARSILTSFIGLYPDDVFADQVKKNLAGLPAVE